MCYFHKILVAGLKNHLFRHFLVVMITCGWGMGSLHAADTRSSSGNNSNPGNANGPVKVNVVHMDPAPNGAKFQIEKTTIPMSGNGLHLTNETKLKTTGTQKSGDKGGNFRNTSVNSGLSDKGFAAKNIFDNAESNFTPGGSTMGEIGGNHHSSSQNDSGGSGDSRGLVKVVTVSTPDSSPSSPKGNAKRSGSGDQPSTDGKFQVHDGKVSSDSSYKNHDDGDYKTARQTVGAGSGSGRGDETQGLVQTVTVTTPSSSPAQTPPLVITLPSPGKGGMEQKPETETGVITLPGGANSSPGSWSIPGSDNGGPNLNNPTGSGNNPFGPSASSDSWKDGPNFDKYKLRPGGFNYGGWDGEAGNSASGGIDQTTGPGDFSSSINTSSADGASTAATVVDTATTAGSQIANGDAGGAAVTVGTAVAPGAAGAVEYGVGVATGDQGKINEGADKTGASVANKVVGFFEGLIIAIGGLLVGGAVVAVAEKSGAADAARGAIAGVVSAGLKWFAGKVGGSSHCGGGEGTPDEANPSLSKTEKQTVSWGQKFSNTLNVYAQAWATHPSGPDPTGDHTGGDHASMSQHQFSEAQEKMGLSGGQGDIDPDAVKAHGSGAALKQAAQIGVEQHK